MIVAFTGLMGSGKSTCANYLVERGFTKINFKDSLIAEVKKNFPELLREIMSYTHHENVDDLLATYPRHPLVRALLQNYGTDVRRRDADNYWVEKWGHVVASRVAPNIPADVTTDDVRFINEAQMVRSLGGIIIRITDNKARAFSGHPSETEQLQIVPDYTINNLGTREDMWAALNSILLARDGVLK